MRLAGSGVVHVPGLCAIEASLELAVVPGPKKESSVDFPSVKRVVMSTLSAGVPPVFNMMSQPLISPAAFVVITIGEDVGEAVKLVIVDTPSEKLNMVPAGSVVLLLGGSGFGNVIEPVILQFGGHLA
jgi:hypothetical protein